MYTSFFKVNCVRYSLFLTGIQETTQTAQHVENWTYNQVQGNVWHKPEETTALILGNAVYQIWDTVQLGICYRVILKLVIKPVNNIIFIHTWFKQITLPVNVWLLIQLPIKTSVSASNTKKDIAVRSKWGNVENMDVNLMSHRIHNWNYNKLLSE